MLISAQVLAFRGECGELPGALRRWSLTCPLVPQESRTFRSNQLFNEDFSKNVRSNNLLEKAISYYRITEGSPVQSLD
jgi:hypothetical protein